MIETGCRAPDLREPLADGADLSGPGRRPGRADGEVHGGGLTISSRTCCELRETDVILMTLTLLDVSLAASLVLMMIFSGYENFVSKIDTGDIDRPAWMGTLDFGGLKLKLISSIVAISGIDLLKSFMNIGQISKEDLMWKVITHMVFVFSGVLLALMDYITERAKKVSKGG